MIRNRPGRTASRLAIAVAALATGLTACPGQEPAARAPADDDGDEKKKAPAPRASDDLDGARLLATAAALLEAGPAAEGLESKPRVRALLLERLRATGAGVAEHAFSEEVPGQGTWDLVNIIASFNPDAPRRVVLGGHWDTRPWADVDPDPAKRSEPVPGANDGVSNTAVLLEVAAVLGARPPPAGFGVDIVLFDGEEGPKGTQAYFLGSKRLAPRWTKVTGRPRPEAGVFVDMVGRRGQKIRREGYSEKKAGALNDEVFAIAARRAARSFADAPSGKFITDDHIAFLGEGIPVVLLIDLDDPTWHTTGDVFANLDGGGMAEVGEVLIAWVRARAAAGSERPR